MSKTLTLNWTNTVPLPSCGFKALYRKKGLSSAYNVLTTSGSTSGSTTVGITLDAPANYEGMIVSDCCASNLSTGDPFGTNSFQPFHMAFYKAPIGTLSLLIEVEVCGPGGTGDLLPYPNPYDLRVTGSFTYTLNSSGVTNTYPFTVILEADTVTSRTTIDTNDPYYAGTVVTSFTISTVRPVFSLNTGGLVGNLQPFDLDKTPDYFQWYWDGSSGTANASSTSCTYGPAALPSFTIDSFTPVVYDGSGDVLIGDLSISWAQEVICSGGTYPHNQFEFTILDPSANEIGVSLTSTTPKGLRSTTIRITRAAEEFIATTKFTLQVGWADGGKTLTGGDFYLPI